VTWIIGIVVVLLLAAGWVVYGYFAHTPETKNPPPRLSRISAQIMGVLKTIPEANKPYRTDELETALHALDEKYRALGTLPEYPYDTMNVWWNTEKQYYVVSPQYSNSNLPKEYYEIMDSLYEIRTALRKQKIAFKLAGLEDVDVRGLTERAHTEAGIVTSITKQLVR
jgi:hypothetical protein